MDVREVWVMFRGLLLCTVAVLYSMSSGALESPDLLPSCSMITLALYNTIIMIITFT